LTKKHPFKGGPGIYTEKAADQGLFVQEGYKLMEYFIKGTLG